MQVIQCGLVQCEYELQIQFHSYFNPADSLANGLCCNRTSQNNCGEFPQCNVLFWFCERPPAVSDDTVNINVFTACQGRANVSTVSNSGTSQGINFTQDVFGIPNPVILTGTGPWVRFFIAGWWCGGGGGGGNRNVLGGM